ncbi:hypothetical protein AA0498_2580 [Acidomonas methanolica]|nr:hypothetical protein AA0498_2580 [Acidomonas methanolica]
MPLGQLNSENRIEKQFEVENQNDGRHDLRERGEFPGNDELAHFSPVGDEQNEGNNGEGQLH